MIGNSVLLALICSFTQITQSYAQPELNFCEPRWSCCLVSQRWQQSGASEVISTCAKSKALWDLIWRALWKCNISLFHEVT